VGGLCHRPAIGHRWVGRLGAAGRGAAGATTDALALASWRAVCLQREPQNGAAKFEASARK
jgi:hypothetical protein